MEEGLFYSESALLNRMLFYSEYNDINVFVEDEYKEYIYENIFQRMFLDELKINKIFTMGGKNGVEKAFGQYGNQYDNKPVIYLVDGDFDLIMGKEMINSPNYIYLDKYNIESYYIEEKAVLKYMSGKMKQTQKKVAEQIEYAIWENMAYDSMTKLFLNYIVAQTVFPEEKSVGNSPHIYFSENGYAIAKKIDEYIDNLKNRIVDYQGIYDLYVEKFQIILFGDRTRLICGKYLLASLSKYLRTKTGTNFKDDDFIYYLVTVFSIEKLDFVKNKVKNAFQNINEPIN